MEEPGGTDTDKDKDKASEETATVPRNTHTHTHTQKFPPCRLHCIMGAISRARVVLGSECNEFSVETK